MLFKSMLAALTLLVTLLVPSVAQAQELRPVPGPCTHKILALFATPKTSTSQVVIAQSKNTCVDSPGRVYTGEHILHVVERCTTTVHLPCFNWERQRQYKNSSQSYSERTSTIYRTTVWYPARQGAKERYRIKSTAFAYLNGVFIRSPQISKQTVIN